MNATPSPRQLLARFAAYCRRRAGDIDDPDRALWDQLATEAEARVAGLDQHDEEEPDLLGELP